MGRKKIDRTGEERLNSFGSKMVIVGYRNNMEYKLYEGDCLEMMDKLIEEGIKVDMILTDPPYGTTACKWDSVIPLDKMWERLNKLIKQTLLIPYKTKQVKFISLNTLKHFFGFSLAIKLPKLAITLDTNKYIKELIILIIKE